MNNTTERSTILLVVLGIDGPSDAASRINVAFLQSIFEKFGTLHKIIIFLKEGIVKAFLEFATPEMSAGARAFLHNCVLNNLGRIKVFFSALQRLEFSSRFIECKDFQPNKVVAPAKILKISAHKAKVLASENLSNQKAATVLARRGRPAADPFVLKEKENFNNTLEAAVNEPKKDSAITGQNGGVPAAGVMTESKTEGRARLESIAEIDCCDPLLTPLPTADTFGQLPESLESTAHNSTNALTLTSLPSELKLEDPAQDSLSLGGEGEQAKGDASGSKVVLISNLDDFFHSASEIFNLFSCFGNIVRVLLMKNLKKAMVEYKKPESAEVALNCMNNRTFGRSKIKVVFSKYKKIDLKRNNKSENSQNFNEVIIVSNKMNRFKNSAAHVIQPSDTLLVVVEKATDLQVTDLMLSVQGFAKPLKTRIVQAEKENADVALHQILFKFSGVIAAMKVLAQAHNSDVNGHFLNVTFAAPLN